MAPMFAQIRRGARPSTEDPVTASALALALEQSLPPSGVTERDRAEIGVRDVANVGDQSRDLGGGVLGRRHLRSRDSVANIVAKSRVAWRVREVPEAKIDLALHVAVLSMAGNAVITVEVEPVLDVGLLVATRILGAKRKPRHHHHRCNSDRRPLERSVPDPYYPLPSVLHDWRDSTHFEVTRAAHFHRPPDHTRCRRRHRLRSDRGDRPAR